MALTEYEPGRAFPGVIGRTAETSWRPVGACCGDGLRDGQPYSAAPAGHHCQPAYQVLTQ